MPNHLDYIRRQTNDPIRVAAMAIGQAVALTDQELLVGHAGVFGRTPAKVDRYRLADLSAVTAEPHGNTIELQLTFRCMAPLKIMFSAAETRIVERIVYVLQTQLDRILAM